MKYCVHYHRNSPFRYFDEVQEIEIKYSKEDLTVPEFLEKNRNKTVILTVEHPEDIDRISNLATRYTNIKIKVDLDNKELTDAAMHSGVPYFFSTMVDDWDTFIGIVNLNPTDVYIVNELGFELDKVASIAHQYNTQIRVFPNVAQSKWAKTPDIKKFFIRPDDISLYEPYVDVIEFFGHEQQLSIYYEAYAHDGKWFGQLNEIINDFYSDIDSRNILPIFGSTRIKCGKRCIKGRACKICERITHFASTLEEQNLLIRVEKNNN